MELIAKRDRPNTAVLDAGRRTAVAWCDSILRFARPRGKSNKLHRHPERSMIDLDNTAGCPLEAHCAGCQRRGRLHVRTLMTPIAVLCRPLCPDCVAHERTPRLSIREAAALVMRHCEHLGIDLDKMAAAARQERGR